MKAILAAMLLSLTAQAQSYLTLPLTNNLVQVSTNYCNGFPCGITYLSSVSNSFDVPKNQVAWFVGLHGLDQVQVQIRSPLIGSNVISTSTAQLAYGGFQAFHPVAGPASISILASTSQYVMPGDIVTTTPPNLVGLGLFRLDRVVVKNLGDPQ